MRTLRIAPLALAIAACGSPAPVSESPAAGLSEAVPETLPSAATYREFRFEKIEQAERLFLEIQADPESVEIRRQLADVYTHTGYLSASQLYSISADLATGEPLKFKPPAETSWIFEGRPSLSVQEEAQAIQRALNLTSKGRAHLARQSLDEFIAQHGLTTSLGATWSFAVLMSAVQQNSAASDQERELAVRLYLTAAAESNVIGGGAVTIAGAYEVLSMVFSSWGDKPTALAAALVAQHELELEGPSADETMRERLNQSICALDRTRCQEKSRKSRAR